MFSQGPDFLFEISEVEIMRVHYISVIAIGPLYFVIVCSSSFLLSMLRESYDS